MLPANLTASAKADARILAETLERLWVLQVYSPRTTGTIAEAEAEAALLFHNLTRSMGRLSPHRDGPRLLTDEDLEIAR